MATEAQGIFQGDFLVETALREGIRDVLANPWLLDYVFRSFRDDPVTEKVYGKKQIDVMKKWITKTEIPVFLNMRLDPARCPCVTINLINSQESENTLADIHHVPAEDLEEPWPALCDPFSPVKWVSATGELTIPPSVTEKTYVFPGMNVMDRFGKLYEILEVRESDEDALVLVLRAGTIADFTGAVIKSKSKPTALHLESALFNESFLVGCHVTGESWQLAVLHALIIFVLLRYREDLLERRGFEVSSVSSTDFTKNQSFDPEGVWSRYISLGGKGRSIWPKRRIGKVQGVDVAIAVTDGRTLPADTNPATSIWMGDEDALTFRKKR